MLQVTVILQPSVTGIVRGHLSSDTFWLLEFAMAKVTSATKQMACLSDKCCFCLIFWKQGQKTFIFLTSCKKQKLKSAKMEPKLQQSQVSPSHVAGLIVTSGSTCAPVHASASGQAPEGHHRETDRGPASKKLRVSFFKKFF